MTIIDRHGRLFGRFNLVDAAAIGFVIVLLPIGYATYLLFRPSRPAIESVTRFELTKEERRIAGGGLLTAKLKVKGSGFNPLLRARIGQVEAVGFVFENPNSADVLVGLVPPGRHDLVLYDGVQEVARAHGAVEIINISAPRVRAYGWLTRLTPAQATELKPGATSDQQASAAFEIVALGPERPARARIGSGEAAADLPLASFVERAAEILVRCDWPSAEACSVGGELLNRAPPIMVTLPGGLSFQIDEVGPASDPATATVRVQLDGPVPPIKVGDRDQIVGSRAAEITAVSGNVVTLRLGADESRDGWRYRGRLLAPGSPFTFGTGNYVAGGRVLSLSIDNAGAER
jgi:hypothetical protein